jgi:hypothetical protein
MGEETVLAREEHG